MHARRMHPRTHARTHARMHAHTYECWNPRMHARAHKHMPRTNVRTCMCERMQARYTSNPSHCLLVLGLVRRKHARTHPRTHPPTPTPPHPRAHACTHAHTHQRTCTSTHPCMHPCRCVIHGDDVVRMVRRSFVLACLHPFMHAADGCVCARAHMRTRVCFGLTGRATCCFMLLCVRLSVRVYHCASGRVPAKDAMAGGGMTLV